IFSETLNCQLKYVTFSASQTREALLATGHFTASAADLLIEMNEKFNSGQLPSVPRTAENSTPTSIENFAKTFKKLLEASPVFA
ncbi:MAG: hypothetical protein ACYCOO_12350, partial [Chitinophagaceae bacterium]